MLESPRSPAYCVRLGVFIIKNKLASPIRVLMMLGWVLLPFTHVRWMPNLGTTRPLSAIPFALALALILLEGFLEYSPRLKELSSRKDIQNLLDSLTGWKFLRWWVILIVLGAISAAFTPLYGNFFQALNRLFGYGVIFIFLCCALYSLEHYGIQRVARWVGIGYLVILPYALVEVLATFNIPFALSIILFIRDSLITPYIWVNRVALLATEPSFVTFQVVLLVTLIPYMKSRLLRGVAATITVIAMLFSMSGTLFMVLAAYIFGLALFSMNRKAVIGLSTAGGITAIAAIAAYALSPELRQTLSDPNVSIGHRYVVDLFGSLTIRYSYVLALIYAMLDTYGLGLGIGQWGQFWQSIYTRHINYQAFDIRGEVARNLVSPEYMRPYSVVFGLGADLGVVGLGLFLGFLYQVFNACRTPHARAILAGALVAFIGAYPIVTPHVWLAIALMGGLGLQSLAASPSCASSSTD